MTAIGKASPAPSSLILLAILLAAALVSGCEISALSRQPATTVYVLGTFEDGTMAAPASRPAAADSVRNDLAIGVSTVGFPPYLERKEIVTRATDSQLVVHQFHKWGSAPDEDFARAVAANLRVLVPVRRAVIPPFRPELSLDYEVRLTVDRFERLADGTVVLDGQWVVLSEPGGRPVANGDAQIRVSKVGEAIPDVVAAMSEAVGQFSNQIAVDLNGLPRRRPHT